MEVQRDSHRTNHSEWHCTDKWFLYGKWLVTLADAAIDRFPALPPERGRAIEIGAGRSFKMRANGLIAALD